VAVAVPPASLAIDAHAHWVPRSLLDDVVRNGFEGVSAERIGDRYILAFAGRSPLRPITGIMIDTADRSGWLAAQGIGHQIVAPWLDAHGQELPRAQGTAWARLLNDSMAEAVADCPASASAHATVHLADPRAAAAELDRAVTELGMRSVMIPASLPEGRLTDDHYGDLWSAAVQYGVPVILHGTTRSPASELLRRYPGLGGLFSRHVEITLTAAELIVTGVLDRFPELRLTLVHGGGFLPYQAARFDRDAQGLMSSGHAPSALLRSLYYDTTLLSPESLRLLYDLVGFDRIVVGSDYGATPAAQAGAEVTESILRSAPETGVAEAVLRGNALRLFRLSGLARLSGQQAGLDQRVVVEDLEPPTLVAHHSLGPELADDSRHDLANTSHCIGELLLGQPYGRDAVLAVNGELGDVRSHPGRGVGEDGFDHLKRPTTIRLIGNLSERCDGTLRPPG
jgi:aminocarboxymuconate-semialdehyde decarboxylase